MTMTAMTALFTADGTRIKKASFPATPVPDPELVTVDEDVYALERADNGLSGVGATDTSIDGRRLVLKYPAGTVIAQSEIDAHYPAATVTAIDPEEGPEEGGTEVTITGTNLSGVSGVKFGNNEGTDLKIVSQTELKVKTPAGSAGAVNVTVEDDSGDVVKSSFFTYVGG